MIYGMRNRNTINKCRITIINTNYKEFKKGNKNLIYFLFFITPNPEPNINLIVGLCVVLLDINS